MKVLSSVVRNDENLVQLKKKGTGFASSFPEKET